MTGPPPRAADDAPGFGGLQAERTTLAWNRTALGLVANAALLSIRELHTTTSRLAAAPIVLAVVVALATVLYARHRDTTLRRDPLPRPVAPRRALIALGSAVTALAITAGGTLLL
ncbi:uncharacterized protein DUF202 [Actinomycetospora succinea]|uniref:Uncharacterized protein DUF202 n=1 Tax=Actinomycetospora succinea TaxID=663603 RepID=A0A4R6VMV3_9PSEU|nr:DUF202 domain-containing protein [Actinomycetospora succinea]TDQ65139.1 uncharacterized protein DUF202 [Actinomycetospora succinea]